MLINKYVVYILDFCYKNAKTARKKSESGIYHIMLRIINKQQIFEEDKDKDKFL